LQVLIAISMLRKNGQLFGRPLDHCIIDDPTRSSYAASGSCSLS
jgi:hypothetical protein